MRFVFLLALTLLATKSFAADETLELGADPLYSGATIVRMHGYPAYVFYASLFRAGLKADSTGLITGESFSCRKYDDKKDKNGEPTYVCSAKFNFRSKGELVPFDPNKDEVEAIREAMQEQHLR